MITTDVDKLEKLFQDLEPKRRMQAMKGAFRKAAKKVKDQAVRNLRQSDFRTNRDLEKGIRQVVGKKKAGFQVTIGTKKTNKRGSGWHTNRRAQTLPILISMEKGTKDRYTKTKASRKRKGHFAGSIKAQGFMELTKNDMKDRITDDLKDALEESIIKTVKKYGKT